MLLNMAVPLYVRVTFIAMVSVVAEFAPVFFRILDASNTPLPLIRQVAASMLNEIPSSTEPFPIMPLHVISP